MVVEEQATKPKRRDHRVGNPDPTGDATRVGSRATVRATSTGRSPAARHVGVDPASGACSNSASGQRDQAGAEAQAEGIG